MNSEERFDFFKLDRILYDFGYLAVAPVKFKSFAENLICIDGVPPKHRFFDVPLRLFVLRVFDDWSERSWDSFEL